ncbi:MAG TPA: hypothetical protein VHP37_23765 [Burkholderiales bacterium]|nr:hypothetical protein [Burkholderiales bacterium]
MMKLRLQVPPDREGTAAATLNVGTLKIATGEAAATAHPLVAKKLGNADCDPLRVGGHPPFGAYRFVATRALEGEQRAEYGSHALVFEPVSGQALEAESFGRLGLLVHGGGPGKDGRLRKTQGGVRLSDALLERVMTTFIPTMDFVLELAPVKPAAWWAFWRASVRTHPLSPEPPGLINAPLDEHTLVQAMLANAPRRPRRTADDYDRRDDDRWRDRDRDSSSSGSSGDTFRGGGGESGGAGASGRWDAPSGVDQAGRIAAGVAAGAAIAGIAAAAAAHDARSDAGSMTDTGQGTAY